MSETPNSTKSLGKQKESWADIDEYERKITKTSSIDKKQKIQLLIDQIFEEDDKVFAKACLEKINRLILSELNQVTNVNQVQLSTSNQQNSVLKFNPDSYKINFHCTTYHWISDCRPKSKIQIKNETHQVFSFKIVNEKPYLGLGENPHDWYELGLNDMIIGFPDEFGVDTKLKVKLVKIARSVNL